MSCAVGEKQHGGLIARFDNVSGCRLSLTAVTSSWSDGSAGPLGLCFPTGMIPDLQVREFNQRHRGECLLFCSERKTHVMNGETWLVLLQQLYLDAFSLQRKKHGLDKSHAGLLLVDAWTGYHSRSTGLDAARAAWSATANCRLPDLQVGGWSACCQPVDQLHHVYRARMDMADTAECGFVADLRQREPFARLAIKANGQPAHKKADAKSMPERSLLAWKSVCGPRNCARSTH